MIVIIGVSHDPTTRHILGVCELYSVQYVYIDLKLYVEKGVFGWDYQNSIGYIAVEDKQVVFSNTELSGAYVRLFNVLRSYRGKALRQAQARLDALITILKSCSFTVINKPYVDLSNGTKFYHLYLLAQFGFRVPSSLITNDSIGARKFVECHRESIYKGASSEKTFAATFENSQLSRLNLLQNSPVVFQEKILGYDVRTHVVGDEIFSEKITSNFVDYRTPNANNTYESIGIPDTIATLCVDFARRSGLKFIGFDFKVSNEGTYFVLEANPMPGYNSYDSRANFAISKSLLRMLGAGSI